MSGRRAFVGIGVVCLSMAAVNAAAAQIVTRTSSPLLFKELKAGAPPTGITVTGTPSTATVTWQPAVNALRYAVSRRLASDGACCNAAATDLTQTSWTDLGVNGNGGLQWAGNYVYRVTVFYADGTVGEAETTWTRPDPVNPLVINGSSSGAAGLRLYWDVVPNASFYMVWGDGLPNTGQQVAGAGTALRTRMQLPGLYVSGLAPGMGSWTVGSFYSPGPVSTAAAQFTKVTHWVTGAAGFGPPRMPTPTFQATELNSQDGALNDRQGVTMATNVPQEQVQGTCPTDVMVFLDGATEPIRAASWYLGETNPNFQFTNMNGKLYFRAPKVASITTGPTAPNAYVYAVNCKGDYTNALPFKIWPTDLHIESIRTLASVTGGSQKFYGGDRGSIFGWGLGGAFNASVQKVMLRAVFQKKTSQELLTVDKEMEVWANDERQVSITTPVLNTLASSVTWVLIDARAYVIKDGAQSNLLAICFNSEGYQGMAVYPYSGCGM